MKYRVYNLDDLVQAAAAASAEGDVGALEELRNVVDGWIQNPVQADSQNKMIDAFIAAIDS